MKSETILVKFWLVPPSFLESNGPGYMHDFQALVGGSRGYAWYALVLTLCCTEMIKAWSRVWKRNYCTSKESLLSSRVWSSQIGQVNNVWEPIRKRSVSAKRVFDSSSDHYRARARLSRWLRAIDVPKTPRPDYDRLFWEGYALIRRQNEKCFEYSFSCSKARSTITC